MPAILRDNILLERELPQTDSILLGRAQMLEESDQVIFKAIIIYKQNAELVGQLTGLKGHWIRRRIRQVVRLITSKPFVSAMRAMPHMSPVDAQIAKLHYCRGLTLSQISRKMGMNPGQSHLNRGRPQKIS